jgi:hypothetical protein
MLPCFTDGPAGLPTQGLDPVPSADELPDPPSNPRYSAAPTGFAVRLWTTTLRVVVEVTAAAAVTVKGLRDLICTVSVRFA